MYVFSGSLAPLNYWFQRHWANPGGCAAARSPLTVNGSNRPGNWLSPPANGLAFWSRRIKEKKKEEPPATPHPPPVETLFEPDKQIKHGRKKIDASRSSLCFYSP